MVANKGGESRSPGSHPFSPAPCHLVELTIRDFAIIDFLRIEWGPGLNVLTGETGAGKSIIIDALGAALGERFDPSWIRSGADRASLEAVFCVPNVGLSGFLPDLAELGCAADDGQLILSRDILAGRSVSRVNGRTVPLASAQQMAECLIDIHSQPSHLSLSRPSERLAILDRYAHTGLSGEMARAARSLIAIRREIRSLEEGERQAEREAALLRHEVGEIDAAEVSEDEEARLVSRRSRLRNALRLRQLAMAAHGVLQGGDEGQGAVDLLGIAAARLEEIKSLDPGFPAGCERLLDVVDVAEDLARALRRYADGIEEDPAALEGVEERLLLLADLKRRYGNTLDEVLRYRQEAARRLRDIETRNDRVAELKKGEAEALRVAGGAARALSAARFQAAEGLVDAVEQEMGALGMAGTRLVVRLERRSEPQGLVIDGDGEPVAFDETGVDRVELEVSPNPGEPPRPLARIASGGEMARLMLALKSALVAVDQTPVLVFDELDQGVGGRMGHVIGEKLWRLGRCHQVLCITHLPQVAAYADAHYAVGKGVADGRTATTVERLGPDGRRQELALMLGGPQAGPAAQRSAEELLARAAEWKRRHAGQTAVDSLS